jgi:hypothetical protein
MDDVDEEREGSKQKLMKNKTLTNVNERESSAAVHEQIIKVTT